MVFFIQFCQITLEAEMFSIEKITQPFSKLCRLRLLFRGINTILITRNYCQNRSSPYIFKTVRSFCPALFKAVRSFCPVLMCGRRVLFDYLLWRRNNLL